MNSFFASLLSVITSVLIALGVMQPPGPTVEFTDLANRDYNYEAQYIQPDASKYVKITVPDTGFDVYAPTEGKSSGYRYGASIITNADGSIDMWTAGPGDKDQWDWIFYTHSPDGGKNWTKEQVVLTPTPGSDDFYSCCDPGVIKIGEYYYIGYTSTVNSKGIENNVFVARSLNPAGPYEKWNGNGWGGKPESIVTYNGDVTTFGAGEPSFIVVKDKLYIYYTWKDGALNQTRLSVADATDENWPATMEYQGVAIDHTFESEDSSDVKYIEDCGKFVAINTVNRFSEDSSIGIYVSDDGLNFKISNFMKTNTSHCCHNAGISSRANGHILLEDDVFMVYAYGDIWGLWATRMHKVDISIINSPDLYEYDNGTNVKTEIAFREAIEYFDPITITVRPHEYELESGRIGEFVKVFKVNDDLERERIYLNIRFSDYDEDVISVYGTYIIPKSAGQTYVTAEWNGYTSIFLVTVK